MLSKGTIGPVAAVVLVASTLASASQAETGTLSGFRVAIALDPALTQSLHMGQRFVAKSPFSTARQKGDVFTVDARAEVGGQEVSASRSAGGGASVSSAQSSRTTISVSGCGVQANVGVSSSKGSRTLQIQTSCESGTIQGTITQ